MRPIDKIMAITDRYSDKFTDGVITVVDDSHGIGAYGATGRGTAEFCGRARHHHRHLRQGLRGERRLHRRQRRGNTIVSVDARQTSSGEIVRLKAPWFADCTGDGRIGYWAGAEIMYGCEDSTTFNENWDKHESYGHLKRQTTG